MKAALIPGVSVAIVDRGEAVFSGSYGFADIAAGRRVYQDTIFHIASLSKIVTATVLIKVLDNRNIDLDDAIAPYLDFPVVNSRYPDTPVTFRHLLMHTSGISDANYSEEYFVTGDPTTSLRDFLVEYFQQSTDEDMSLPPFLDSPPGNTWDYSNVAYGLAGYLIGRIANAPPETIIQTVLFNKIPMPSASWTLDNLNKNWLATPYAKEGTRATAIPNVGYPDWPGGLLRTSMRDYAALISVFTDKATRLRSGLLKDETILEMLSTQEYADINGKPHHQALTFYDLSEYGLPRIGHTGGDPGSSTMIAFSDEKSRAVIVFANTSSSPASMEFRVWVAGELLELSCF